MRNVDSYMNNKTKIDINAANKKNFMIAMQNNSFVALVSRLKTDEKKLIKYTSKLENTINELSYCKNCKGLDFCKTYMKGYIDYPEVDEIGELVFSYTPCRYKKEELRNKANTIFYETPKTLKDARMSKIYIDDESRREVLNYIQKFMKEYPNIKGIYLYGSFGSGKSYILNALINELSKRGNKCVSVYYPLLLKKLKDSFNNKNLTYEEMYNELESCDCLLIDDIGAENNTPWARDEVLGGILQSRMDNNKHTFFTSNFNLEELENHLSETTSSQDRIKARRIIERIKQLSTPISLIGENKRDL